MIAIKLNKVCSIREAEHMAQYLCFVELPKHWSILGKWLQCREGPQRLVKGERVGGKEQQIDPLSIRL